MIVLVGGAAIKLNTLSRTPPRCVMKYLKEVSRIKCHFFNVTLAHYIFDITRHTANRPTLCAKFRLCLSVTCATDYQRRSVDGTEVEIDQCREDEAFRCHHAFCWWRLSTENVAYNRRFLSKKYSPWNCCRKQIVMFSSKYRKWSGPTGKWSLWIANRVIQPNWRWTFLMNGQAGDIWQLWFLLLWITTKRQFN